MGMLCHCWRARLVFEHSFFFLASRDPWKRTEDATHWDSSQGERSYLPYGHCSCSCRYFQIIFHLAIADNARHHKLGAQCKAEHNWPCKCLHNFLGKQQPVCTNKDCKYRCTLNNSFQKQSNDGSTNGIFTSLDTLHKPSEDSLLPPQCSLSSFFCSRTHIRKTQPRLFYPENGDP